MDGIRSDFAEIGGRFKSGITKLSGGAKAVSELSKMATKAGTGPGSGINIPITNDEDVSFSDLEEDDTDIPADTKKATYTSDSSTKSRDWVQLSRSSSDSAKENKLSDVKLAGSPNKESNDWLNVEDIDEI
ncbi:hypothetical protein QQ045_003735 [Rhodiola kirilowii]